VDDTGIRKKGRGTEKGSRDGKRVEGRRLDTGTRGQGDKERVARGGKKGRGTVIGARDGKRGEGRRLDTGTRGQGDKERVARGGKKRVLS